MTTETNKQRFVRTLREAADYIESRPFDEDIRFATTNFHVFCDEAVQFSKHVAAAGNAEKSGDDGYLNATIRFGQLAIQICIKQEDICTRVRTGTKVVPAQPATPERTEDVYKYQCPDSFLALKDGPVTEIVETEVQV